MIKSLSIKNVVLIDKLDLEFPKGFVVFSGETGAGKSILLDSLGLVLGKRADVSMIRAGEDKLSVAAVFELDKTNKLLKKICDEYDLEYTDEIIIKRSLSTDGKGKIFFNDQPITQKLLKEIGATLVEIHGQFDNQGLLNPATHREVLDNYGNHKEHLQTLSEKYFAWKKVQKEREILQKNLETAKDEEENLSHWLEEFEKLNPKENEVENLETKRKQMMNSEKIAENLDVAYKALSQTGVRSSVRQALSAVARLNTLLDDKYSALGEVLDSALINLEEAEEEIMQATSEINFSADDINALEERLFALKGLARKHRTLPENLPEVWRELKLKLQGLNNGENNLAELMKAEEKAKAEYLDLAKVVSLLRKKDAAVLDKKIMAQLPDLKMEKALFITEILPKDECFWNEFGIDEVCFKASTNANTSFGNLNKIASGGELARFMLAIKVNLAQSSDVSTMIFDEIDTGIGGATAQAVGEKLANLGKNIQVMVVTHSPQVAALSSHHFKVEKNSINNATFTVVVPLDEKQKSEEIARMLAGETISDEARAAAKVLIGA